MTPEEAAVAKASNAAQRLRSKLATSELAARRALAKADAFGSGVLSAAECRAALDRISPGLVQVYPLSASLKHSSCDLSQFSLHQHCLAADSIAIQSARQLACSRQVPSLGTAEVFTQTVCATVQGSQLADSHGDVQCCVGGGGHRHASRPSHAHSGGSMPLVCCRTIAAWHSCYAPSIPPAPAPSNTPPLYPPCSTRQTPTITQKGRSRGPPVLAQHYRPPASSCIHRCRQPVTSLPSLPRNRAHRRTPGRKPALPGFVYPGLMTDALSSCRSCYSVNLAIVHTEKNSWGAVHCLV